MGARSDQIKEHIEATRSELGNNLNELENRVKRATDWRRQFQENPMTVLTVAFGGGVLLSSMLGGSKRSYSSSPSPAVERARNKASGAWENTKGALIALAATRARAFLGEAIPGFREQYERTEREAKNPSSEAMRQLPDAQM